MFLSVLGSMSLNLIYFTLHVLGSGGSFPKPLTQQEEDEYIAKMQAGDMEARSILIERNLRLVAHIIKKYYANAKDQDDLVSIGTIGLIKAVSTFNGCKGTRLATYASRCIENEILMYFRNNKKLSQEISFSDPIETDSDGNPLTLMDIIAIDDTIVEDIDTKNKLINLVKIINNMTNEREKTIIIKRYGLDGNKPLTQKEIAKDLSISRSYVSRIEKKILADIKESI